jgi:hypothetical protein
MNYWWGTHAYQQRNGLLRAHRANALHWGDQAEIDVEDGW